MPRLPAEWEPQVAVMLTWPHAETDWADQLPAVERVYTHLATQIARFEPVLIVCRDGAHRAEIAERLRAAAVPAERLLLAQAPSNDTWARDHGPIGVLDDGQARLVDFRFNGWGGKFRADLDDAITASLHRSGVFGDTPVAASRLVLEGGAIESDGAGTLLAVERTLVDDRRNPAWDRAEVETEIARLLGIRRFLWLRHGALTGDDTDGHIDTLVRFCSPDTLCYVRCEDPTDPDHAELAAMELELRALRTASGNPYRLVPLPHPAPLYDSDARRLPATYANFLVINRAVLLPVYGDTADRLAAERLAGLFPDREVVPIDCRALIRQGGSLHCISMQLPEALGLSAPPWSHGRDDWRCM